MIINYGIFLGLLLKESLFGGMEEALSSMMYSNSYMDSYDFYGNSGSGSYGASPSINFVSPSSYYGDPTRVFDSAEEEELVRKFH